MNRVLIVDDAATVRMYHRSILEADGFEVEEAVNGLEAIERALASASDRAFDLYLVDINMPRLDGYGFLRALRSESIYQAPAVMVSTEGADQDEEEAYRAGANAYMTKPIRPEELRVVARMLVGLPTP